MNHVQCLEHVSSRSASFHSRVNGRSALVPAVCMTLHWNDRHEYQKMQIDVVPRSHGHEYNNNNIIIIILYLPSAVFIAHVLVGPSKQLKQIIQIKHNIVKNPNGPEANQLAIYKRGRGFELGRTEKQIQVVARAGLEPGTAGLRVRHADHSTTLPPSDSRFTVCLTYSHISLTVYINQ